MKHNIRHVPIFILLLFIMLTGSCLKVSTGDDDPDPVVERSAKYKIGSTDITVSKPYDGIYIDNGVTDNLVSLTGKDGSEIDFYFEGTKPATFQLKKYPDAVYKSPSAATYNAVRGSLIVTEYKSSGASNSFSGTFSFVAKNINNAKDSVVITNGVITNCNNDLQ